MEHLIHSFNRNIVFNLILNSMHEQVKNAKRCWCLKEVTDEKGISINYKFRQYFVGDDAIFGNFFYLFQRRERMGYAFAKKNAKIIAKK